MPRCELTITITVGSTKLSRCGHHQRLSQPCNPTRCPRRPRPRKV